jgi:hypothetical protein
MIVSAFFIAFSHIKMSELTVSAFLHIKNKALNRPFTRNNSPSSDHRRMLYSSFERARRELSNDMKIIFLASIDCEIIIK